MDVSDLDLRDFHSVPNALMRGSSDPATVSFEVEWKRVKKRGTLRDTANQFSLEFVETDVTVEWSAEKSNFSFESEPNSVQPGATPFSIVGRERNGVFFE